MAENTNIATVSKSRASAKSDSSSSIKSEKENLNEEIEKQVTDNDVDQMKAQHQPLVATAPKRRGKGASTGLR